jgi:ABC-type tungstate transport system substrate-binding protein
MGTIMEGFHKALLFIMRLDAELPGIIFLSLKVSGLALIIATVTGLPPVHYRTDGLLNGHLTKNCMMYFAARETMMTPSMSLISLWGTNF